MAKNIPVRVVRELDGWELVKSCGLNDPHLGKRPARFIAGIIPADASEDHARVYAWAALKSRESFEQLIAEPALVAFYLEEASDQLDNNAFVEIMRMR